MNQWPVHRPLGEIGLTMDAFRPIVDLLGRVRARWQAIRVLRATCRAAIAVSIVLTVSLIVVVWMARSPLVLGSMGLLFLLLAAGAMFWALAPFRGRPTDAQLARFIEEHAPSLDDRLATAVDLMWRSPSGLVKSVEAGLPPSLKLRRTAEALAEAGQTRPQDGLKAVPYHVTSPHTTEGEQHEQAPAASALAGPMLADAVARARTVDVESVVPTATVRRAAASAAGAILMLAAVAVVGSGPARQVLDAAALVLFPSRAELDVRPGDTRVRAGTPLSIEARLVGTRSPIDAQIQIAVGNQWRTSDMTRDSDGTFHLTVGSVEAPFRYRVVAQNLISSTYSVTVARPPQVTRIDLDYTYPPAIGLKPRSEQNGGDIYAPAGTDVRVRIHTDLPISTGRLTLGDAKAVPLTVEAPTRLFAVLKIVGDNSYRVAVVDDEGLSNGSETEYFIRVLDDRPPEVHVTKPAGDRAVTRLEEVDIEAQVDDDYGVDRLELVYALRGGVEHVAGLAVPRHATSASVRHTLYLEDLDVQPGDFVSYYVRARDVARGKKSNEARSDIFFLDVRPYEQEFSLAQSQSMAGSGYAGAIDDLVSAQRQVVVATWKLDRRARSGGGRSEPDIRAIARAEADLKSRIEQTASSFRESTMRDPRRRVGGGNGDSGSAARPGDNAMTAAALAIGRAVTSLEALQTTEALVPEMEALNHLLRAQADIRHRQVAMDQSAAGAAGNSNRNFDISTLFDQELRRQQQTSYETLKTSERQQTETSILDRIRDLARRQDELLKRQQEMARGQVSGDELKRQLEQLTREQSELRQVAEELARQASSQPRQAGRSSRDNDDNRGQLRDASDAMRQATADLRRGATNEAGSSAGRALEKLRDLAKRLQSSQPDAWRRALGDLQLEARDIADRQRQLSSELAKLAQQDTKGDAMRRVASEEERLADRVGRLLDGVKQQAAAERIRSEIEGGKRQAIVGDAARELEVQRLLERMQQSAYEIRTAAVDATRGAPATGPKGDPRSQAGIQQDLARELDRLADRLGAARDDKDDTSRQLSAELDRARDLRKRLDQVARAFEGAEGQPRTSGGERSSQKQPGEQGRTGEGRQGAGGVDLSRLNEESLRHLREAKELIDQLRRDDPAFSRNGAGFTLEGQGMISSAPGTEGFKQDFARWEALRRQVTLALEQAETTLSTKLQANESKNRLAAGVEDRPPSEYQRQVDSYFKAIAAGKKQ
jgi:hypothetical protein